MAQPGQLDIRVAAFYQHVQATPAAVWTVVHGLYVYPVVDVFVVVNGVQTKIIPSAITYVDNVTLTVTFQTARSGVAMVS